MLASGMTPPGMGHTTSVEFDRYVGWYDAFNQHKRYDVESQYVLSRVEHVAGRPGRWLDIGCGTGHHVGCLERLGINVEGLDRCDTMIGLARTAYPTIPFVLGAAQDLTLRGERDVVSMLFHVISYQVSDADLTSALERISESLTPGGTFVFDFWNSEAVPLDPPGRRVREAKVDGRSLFRVSTPVEDRRRRLIEVHFEFRWDAPDGPLIHDELHTVRHFSADELRTRLRNAGMTVAVGATWMQDRPLSRGDWYGFICARRDAN